MSSDTPKDFERIDKLEKDIDYLKQIIQGHMKRQEKLLEYYAELTTYFKDILKLTKDI